VKEFMASTAAVLEAWPEGVKFPPTAYAGHALSLERIGALMRDTFVPDRPHADKRPPRPVDYLQCAADAGQNRGFSATERQLGEEWLADLKAANSSNVADVPKAEDSEKAA
jgi:hypothetical protein